MAVSKVTYNGTTLIDLTGDTVAADKLLSGYTAHDKAGQIVTGTLTAGTVPANGSLIVCNCSTDITAVEAVYNGITAGAYLDTVNHIAYVTIPYTYVGTVTLYGYSGSIIRTSGTVTISGVDKYLCPLSTSSILFNRGTWTGYGEHNWDVTNNRYVVTESGSYITIQTSGENGEDYIYLEPKVDFRGYSSINLKVYSKLPTASVRAYVETQKGTTGRYGVVDINDPGTYNIPVASDIQGQPLYIVFWVNVNAGAAGSALGLERMEFV